MKKIILILLFLLMIGLVAGAECNWNNTQVINCVVSTNVAITGTHTIANVSLNNNVYVNLNNALMTTNTSWTFVLNNAGTNNMFLITGDNVTIDGNSNSRIEGVVDCDANYGTTGINIGGTRNNPVAKNIYMDKHMGLMRWGGAVNGLIENNILNESVFCHPAIYGTGNHTLITNNDIAGSVWFFGGETNLVGNRDLDVEDTDCSDDVCCERPHFGFENTASWEGNPYWYGKVTDNTFATSCGGGRANIQYYTGNGLNISNNKDISLEYHPSVGTHGNEYYLNNTGYLYLAVPPEETPVLCLDGLHNTFGQIGIYHEGNWKASDWVCAGETMMNDTSITIQYSDVYFNCDGVTINDFANQGYQPLQIWGDMFYEFSTHNNVSVENCNFWNSYGTGIGLYTRNGNVMTNINLKDISIVSTSKSIEGFGVNGLYIDNITGTDCGASIGLFDASVFGSDYAPNSNIVINDSYFSGGGCAGGSSFQTIDGLKIENSVFEFTGDLTQEALSVDYTSVDNLDIHNTSISGGVTTLGAMNTGLFYDNNILNLILTNDKVDICNGGAGNTMQQIGFWYDTSFTFDNSCNPLYLPDGIKLRAWNYTGGEPQNFVYNINGNGVNLTGNGLVGIETTHSDGSDFKVVNSTIENFIISGYSTSLKFDTPTITNTFKDSVVTKGYQDLGTGNTFSNITNLCSTDWSCNGYETCVDPMPNVNCNSVVDLNTCGEIYSGNYSEFISQTCSYPPPITGYVPAHTSSDVPSVVVDFIVEFGIQIIAFVGLIALVALYLWFQGAI